MLIRNDAGERRHHGIQLIPSAVDHRPHFGGVLKRSLMAKSSPVSPRLQPGSNGRADNAGRDPGGDDRGDDYRSRVRQA
jgi:hypothetical protein